MSTNHMRIKAVVFFLTICSASLSPAMGQQTPASRMGPPRIIKYDGDMTSMLARLTDIYGVTIGFEVDPLQPKPQVGFDLHAPTLADVLNAITRSAPRYQWRESGGVVEVLPLEGSSPLLDTIIFNFRVKDVDEGAAMDQFWNLPEVLASMRGMGLARLDPDKASTEKKERKFSISLENVNMRQALNTIAKENGTRFWIFRRVSKGFFSISNFVR